MSGMTAVGSSDRAGGDRPPTIVKTIHTTNYRLQHAGEVITIEREEYRRLLPRAVEILEVKTIIDLRPEGGGRRLARGGLTSADGSAGDNGSSHGSGDGGGGSRITSGGGGGRITRDSGGGRSRGGGGRGRTTRGGGGGDRTTRGGDGRLASEGGDDEDGGLEGNVIEVSSTDASPVQTEEEEETPDEDGSPPDSDMSYFD